MIQIGVSVYCLSGGDVGVLGHVLGGEWPMAFEIWFAPWQMDTTCVVGIDIQCVAFECAVVEQIWTVV